MRACVSAGAAIAALSAAATAGGITVTYRDTLNIPFNVGTGNTNTNFAISRDSGSGVELGLKAKERFFGDANVGGTGGTYIVQNGYSPVSNSNPSLDPPNAWWNFDISIDLGSHTFNDTSVRLAIVNNINSQWDVIDISAYIQSLGGGSLSVAQDSLNLGFAGFAGLGFDANDVGTYTFRLQAWSLADGPLPPVGDVGMTVQVVDRPVVPLPSAAGLGFAGIVGIAGARRRR